MSVVAKSGRYITPPEYATGVGAGNSLAVGGFSEHHTISRFSANNGTDFSSGRRITMKLESQTNLLHGDQVYLKWKPQIKKGGNIITDPGDAILAVQGHSAALKQVTLSNGGRTIETIPNYNRFTAQQYINGPLEWKMYLAKTEGASFLINGEPNEAPAWNYEEGYVIHKLSLASLKSLVNFELPLVPNGLDFEFLVADVSEIFPSGGGPGGDIESYTMTNVELICVGTKPTAGFWEDRADYLRRGGKIERPLQVLRFQSCQGNGGTTMSLNVDSGMIRSASSAMVLGVPNFDAGTAADGKPPLAAGSTVYDKLSYSSDLGLRTIRFVVGGKQIPEGRAISYSKYDPELFVLGFRMQNPENNAFVPSMAVFDDTRAVKGLSVRGFQARYDFKDSLSAYGDGLMSINGTFSVQLSTVPEAPEFPTAVRTFKPAEVFEIYWVQDNILVITDRSFSWTPVF
jgi:hypothetical protein